MATRISYAERNARSLRRHGQSLYERRIAAGARQGRTKQFARGHGYKLPGGPTEYKKRQISAVAEGRALPAERAFVRRQAAKSASADFDDMLERFLEYSPSQRRRIMQIQASLHRKYVAAGRPRGQRIIPRHVPGGESAAVIDVPGIGLVRAADFDTGVAMSEPEFDELYPDFEDDWLDDDSPFIWYH